jgi:hypothetical protein
MTESQSLTVRNKSTPAIIPKLPAIVAETGNAGFAWDEFFAARMQNPRTRAAYGLAIRKFFAWLDPKGISLREIAPATVGEYFAQHPGSVPTRKLDLAALRALTPRARGDQPTGRLPSGQRRGGWR